jgi:hypothetical protein
MPEPTTWAIMVLGFLGAVFLAYLGYQEKPQFYHPFCLDRVTGLNEIEARIGFEEPPSGGFFYHYSAFRRQVGSSPLSSKSINHPSRAVNV